MIEYFCTLLYDLLRCSLVYKALIITLALMALVVAFKVIIPRR